MADYLRDKYYPGAHTRKEMEAMDKARSESSIPGTTLPVSGTPVTFPTKPLVKTTHPEIPSDEIKKVIAHFLAVVGLGPEENLTYLGALLIDQLKDKGYSIIPTEEVYY
jgi:hypothetical protein